MPPQPGLYFVQISDTHLGSAESYRRARKVVEHINRLPVDIACVVHTGDVMDFNILDAREVKKARELFGALRAPIHFLPGNHDILPDAAIASQAMFREHFGELSSRHQYSAVEFLLVDTSELTEHASAEIVQRTLASVEEHLRAVAGKSVIVFHHEPCVPFMQPRQARFVGGWSEDAARAWAELLNAYRVRAVIAGHCHQEVHHWAGNVPIYVAPSVIFGKPDCRLFEYRDGRLAHWTLHVEPPKPLTQRVRDKLKAYIGRFQGRSHLAHSGRSALARPTTAND